MKILDVLKKIHLFTCKVNTKDKIYQTYEWLFRMTNAVYREILPLFYFCPFVLRRNENLANWIIYTEKKEEIWPSPMTKAPTPTEMSKSKVTTQTTPQKSLIKQQLRTDLGRII